MTKILFLIIGIILSGLMLFTSCPAPLATTTTTTNGFGSEVVYGIYVSGSNIYAAT